jgi:hypothetical protein
VTEQEVRDHQQKIAQLRNDQAQGAGEHGRWPRTPPAELEKSCWTPDRDRSSRRRSPRPRRARTSARRHGRLPLKLDVE